MKFFNCLIPGLFLSIIITTGLQAQQRSCYCLDTFDDMIAKLEENYIGLRLNNSGSTVHDYEKRKLQTRKLATKAKSENCTAILQDFLSQLKDGHVFVFEQPEYNTSELNKVKERLKSSVIDLNKIERKRFSNTTDEITGKWTDGISEILILKEGKAFNAYITQTTDSVVSAGELKASIKKGKNGFAGVLYSYQYAAKFVEAQLFKESTLLNFGGGAVWGRLNSGIRLEDEMINKADVTSPFIKQINDETVLFSIPSFLVDGSKFNEFLMENVSTLSNARNLIFDIRGNTGGNALYMAFLDAYADRPLPGSQGLVLASGETKKYFERQAKYNAQLYQPVIDSIQQNLGKVVAGPAYPEKEFKPFPTKIMNVAILTDEGCMSAAESFILHSKAASSKVTTFGRATAGVIDYTSVNVIKLNSGNQNIYFGYPTSTLHKNIPLDGYNKTGVIPDVVIPKEVVSKVDYIVEYYSKQNN